MTISEGIGFSTKETPNSSHTKAALKVKGVLTIVEYEDDYIEALVE
jgi:D-serine dehydratase